MKNYVFIVFAIWVSSCAQPTKQETNKTAILIKDIAIIDVNNGTILDKKHIVIDSGKIKNILDSVENSNQFSLQIDGTGKFAIPGLAEMHAHIPQPPTSQKRIEEILFLYLSNGITTIRGMLGHASHLDLREKATKNEILSPRIFTSSPSLNGNSVKTKEEAISKVTQYKKDGYDFLKIHPGIQQEVFDQLVKTADEVDMSFSGHVPVDVGIRHALDSKYASIDHIDGFLEGLVPEKENVNPNENGFFGYNFAPLADESKIDELVQLADQNEVWIVPTQSLFERWFAPITADKLLEATEMKYMNTSTLQSWKQRKAQYTVEENQWNRFNDIRRKLLKKLQDNGGRILLGSDAPQLFNVPGFSIHHEIDGMIKAGLSPLEILQSGTINPAKFFAKEDSFGQIKEGLDADLVILDTNPLEDIKALMKINGVIIRGQWLPKEMIDKKLEEIAERAIKN